MARLSGRRIASRAVCAAAIVALAAAAPAHGASRAWTEGPAATLRFAGLGSDTIAVGVSDEIAYLSVNAVSQVFAASKSWERESSALLLRIGGHEARLAVGNPVAVIDGRSVLLSGPVRLRDGVAWLPLDFATEHLVPLAAGRVVWSAATREFAVGGDAGDGRHSIGANAPDSGVTTAAEGPRGADGWPGFAVRTVVIDPGHGGAEDLGVSAGGFVEKDLTLAVALAARSLIEQRLGARVTLTRESDTSVPAERRAEIANREGGDLFISIHLNASSDSTADGLEAGVAAVGPTDAARAGVPGAAGAIRFVPWRLAQARFIEESSSLAESMGDALSRGAGVANRGVRRGRFAVLSGVLMPATLIELGFVTNASDATRLGSAGFRDRVAEGIVKGIESFATLGSRELR